MSGFREKSQEFFGSSPISIFDLEACLPRSKSQGSNTFICREDTVPRLASSSKTEGAVRQGEFGTAKRITVQEDREYHIETVQVENTARPILTSSTSSSEDPTAVRVNPQVSSLEVLVQKVKVENSASSESPTKATSVSFSCRKKLYPNSEEREEASSASAKGLETRQLSIRKRRFQPLNRLFLNHRSLNIAQTGVTVSPPRTLLPRGLPSTSAVRALLIYDSADGAQLGHRRSTLSVGVFIPQVHAFFDSMQEKRSSSCAEFQSRWNFDTKMGLPKLGSWEWTSVSAE